ncbi:ABC transporter ATP-binding protein [Roseateles sp.]|uniref:ABC transporter ATP-binding protein n=1 Tax=Roseateles sp. TaxID=1971397 RepID=UPI00286AE088|nr:ABC transporter ATP-binding protein [Roseateles sp.]
MPDLPFVRPLIEFSGLCKTYAGPSGGFHALQDLQLKIGAGECLAVVGKSGSGKTTLINLLAGIDSPTGGALRVGDADLRRLSEEQMTIWRGRQLGLVFQFFQLLPTLTVLENVMLPMDFCASFPAAQRRGRALGLLSRLGVEAQAHKLPSALSGGQQQRVAIARALANDPPLLLADEPTGNLDSATAREVMGLLAALAAAGKTVLVVTHEADLSRFFTRSITLHDGRIVHDSAAPASETP